MEPAERDKMLYEWLKSENELVNKQISSWSEADQKLIAVMASVVGAIIGLSSSKYVDGTANVPSYMLMLASVLMTLAVIQSSLYSSLILLALERKVELSKRTGEFLGVDPDFVMTLFKPPNTIPFRSYKVGVVPYLLFRACAGLFLSFAALYCSMYQYYDYRWAICITLSFGFSITALFVTINHALALFAYNETLGNRPGAPPSANEAGTIGDWKTWLLAAPCFPG